MALGILNKLAVSGAYGPHFSLHNGLVRYNSEIWLGPTVLHSNLEWFLHSTTVLLAVNGSELLNLSAPRFCCSVYPCHAYLSLISHLVISMDFDTLFLVRIS